VVWFVEGRKLGNETSYDGRESSRKELAGRFGLDKDSFRMGGL
jgi:hypothetical protein